MSEVRVAVDFLRRANQILLDHLEEVAGSEVVLESDYFWAIPPEQSCDGSRPPTEFTIGQLSECLENLSSIIKDPSLAVSYGLVWMAELLRAAGQAVVEYWGLANPGSPNV